MGNRKENERKGSMDGRIQEKSNGQMSIYTKDYGAMMMELQELS